MSVELRPSFWVVGALSVLAGSGCSGNVDGDAPTATTPLSPDPAALPAEPAPDTTPPSDGTVGPEDTTMADPGATDPPAMDPVPTDPMMEETPVVEPPPEDPVEPAPPSDLDIPGCRETLGDVPVCCVPDGADQDNVLAVFDLLNEYRSSLGLAPLEYDDALGEAVQGHVMHMALADFFAHESPTPGLTTPWDRAEYCGTTANAENIAAGQRSPEQVMDSWRNSAGHDQNMRGDYTRVGIGEYENYWGQLFGN